MEVEDPQYGGVDGPPDNNCRQNMVREKVGVEKPDEEMRELDEEMQKLLREVLDKPATRGLSNSC
ncbi:MAG: hypothetical protein KAS93_03165 [Gammaproteobacteria bacterium]|nr:hypothetical protein [Gammaproteobacteria bacterium]